MTTLERIQQICNSAFNADGTLKDHLTVKLALQEIFTIANEAQSE